MSVIDSSPLGVALSAGITTRPVHADILTTSLRWHVQRIPFDRLMLHIMGEKLPVLIPRGKTVLGRTRSSGMGMVFDLSKYFARVRGVSREHALITFTAAGWTVEDLSSTNGVWVNNTKLAAYQPHLLRNGDMVELGQLTLFVYFR